MGAGKSDSGRFVRRPPFRRHEKGSAVVLALVIALVAAASVAALLESASVGGKESSLHERELRAFYAAEAGLAEARAEVNDGVDAAGDGLGNVAGTIGGESYQVVATQAGDEWTLATTGIAAGVRRRVAEALAPPPGPFVGAFLSAVSTTIAGATIDSYDSTVGTYASQVVGVDPNTGVSYAGANGDVGSLGAITVSGSSVIYGDLRPGENGSAVILGGDVSGGIVPFSDPPDLDPVVYSPPAMAAIDLTLSGSQTFTYANDTFRFSKIKMSGQSRLNLSGDVVIYLDGNFDLSGSAEVNVMPNSDVQFYQGNGTVSLTGNGFVNQTNDPSALRWYSSSNLLLKFAGTADFMGVIYAPDAAIDVSGIFQGYGAAVGKTVVAGGSSVWHYDEALRTLLPWVVPPSWGRVSWVLP